MEMVDKPKCVNPFKIQGIPKCILNHEEYDKLISQFRKMWVGEYSVIESAIKFVCETYGVQPISISQFPDKRVYNFTNQTSLTEEEMVKLYKDSIDKKLNELV